MRLDPDLIREILLHIEDEHQSTEWSYNISTDEDYPRFYTASKLLEAGYVRAQKYSGDGLDEVISISELTFGGHTFLENVRDPAVWSYVKRGAGKVGSLSIDVLSAVARAYFKTKIQEVTGIIVP